MVSMWTFWYIRFRIDLQRTEKCNALHPATATSLEKNLKGIGLNLSPFPTREMAQIWPLQSRIYERCVQLKVGDPVSLTARRSQRVETGHLFKAVATAEEISKANGFCRTGCTED